MATTRKRKTIEEQIAEYEAKVKALKEAKRKQAKAKKELTRDSEGIANLIEALDAAAKANKVKRPVVIKALAKLTRSGLKFAE